MSLKDAKDKLEIGLEPDAPYRPTNLPDSRRPHPPHPPGTDPSPEDAENARLDDQPTPRPDDR
ncbi:MAG: hypothetical protein IT183_01140 [Acidobacteria bacterium]|nr:hypothetical protein [Acidobacteriota bacterium]